MEEQNDSRNRGENTDLSGMRGLSNDPLFLANSDYPGAQLVTSVFDGTNFVNWGRGIRMALGAKNKLGFIDGSCAMPEAGTADFQRWIRANYMVRCWILNSMKSEMSDSFIYVESSKELWLELIERYAQSNAPLLFGLKRKLANLRQGNLSMGEYFNKLKRLWDEIQILEPLPSCDCGVLKTCTCNLMKKTADMEEKNKLMQFLMGLNDGYEAVRSQILGMDTLPSVRLAYSMVYQVETGKVVITNKPPVPEMSAFQVSKPDITAFSINKQQNQQAQYGERRDYLKDFRKTKQEKKCDFCKYKGHTKDECFKVHGYPEWYKEKYGHKLAANVTNQLDHPFEENEVKQNFAGKTETIDNAMISAMCEEVMRRMKGKEPADNNNLHNFAGPYH